MHEDGLQKLILLGPVILMVFLIINKNHTYLMVACRNGMVSWWSSIVSNLRFFTKETDFLEYFEGLLEPIKGILCLDSRLFLVFILSQVVTRAMVIDHLLRKGMWDYLKKKECVLLNSEHGTEFYIQYVWTQWRFLKVTEIKMVRINILLYNILCNPHVYANCVVYSFAHYV